MPKNFVGEPFSVSPTSGIEKLYASAGYVTIFGFLSKIFCLTVPKISVGELLLLHSFPVAKNFGYEWGEEYQDFPSKVFVSQCGNLS